MRHIRFRRRFKIILTLLLVLCVLVFVEGRIEAFVPQLKGLAELKVEETLNNHFKFSIGSIDGGILCPFVLNDI